MSIQNEIDRITSNIADAYSAVEKKGGPVPDEANSNNLPEAILSIPGESGGAGEVYSTEEVRIGTWIDGKPLYRRVAEYKPTHNTDSGTVYSIVSIADAFIVSLRGIMQYDNAFIHSLPYVTADTNGTISAFLVGFTSGVVQFRLTASATASLFIQSITAVVEYTKTTDEPEAA